MALPSGVRKIVNCCTRLVVSARMQFWRSVSNVHSPFAWQHCISSRRAKPLSFLRRHVTNRPVELHGLGLACLEPTHPSWQMGAKRVGPCTHFHRSHGGSDGWRRVKQHVTAGHVDARVGIKMRFGGGISGILLHYPKVKNPQTLTPSRRPITTMLSKLTVLAAIATLSCAAPYSGAGLTCSGWYIDTNAAVNNVVRAQCFNRAGAVVTGSGNLNNCFLNQQGLLVYQKGYGAKPRSFRQFS